MHDSRHARFHSTRAGSGRRLPPGAPASSGASAAPGTAASRDASGPGPHVLAGHHLSSGTPPSSDRGWFRVHVGNDPVRVEVGGEIDLANAWHLEDALVATQPLDEGQRVLVDTAAVTFLDASGLNALLRAQSFARHHDGDVLVVNPSRCVQRLLEITRLEDRLLAPRDDHDR